MRAAPGRRRVPQTSLGSPSFPHPRGGGGRVWPQCGSSGPFPFPLAPRPAVGAPRLTGPHPASYQGGGREIRPSERRSRPPPRDGSPARPAREDRDLSAPSNAPPPRPRRSPPRRRDTRAQILARAALGVSGQTPAPAPAAYPPQHLSLSVSRSRRPLLRRGQGVPWFPCPGPLRPACCGFCSWG